MLFCNKPLQVFLRVDLAQSLFFSKTRVFIYCWVIYGEVEKSKKGAFFDGGSGICQPAYRLLRLSSTTIKKKLEISALM